MIKPSIVHTPEWRKEDEDERDAMFDSGGIKDGRGYYLWLLPKANTTGLVDQSKFRKITTRPLPPTADRTVLDKHMLEHLDAWKHLNTTDPANVRGCHRCVREETGGEPPRCLKIKTAADAAYTESAPLADDFTAHARLRVRLCGCTGTRKVCRRRGADGT